MLNFRRGERVNCYVEIFFDEPQHFFIPAQRQIGMQSALNHQLCSACVDGLLNFAQNFVVRQKIRAVLIFASEECAELALVPANVRIIYVAVDDESHRVAEFFFADGVGSFAKFKQVARLEKFQCRVAR